MMKHIITISLIFVSLAALAQPVTRIRLITLQDPPDTTTQYFIQAGGGRDTIKYVPIDSLGVGGTTITFAADSGTPVDRTDGETLTITGAGIASTAASSGKITITATEVDGSVSNEGSLTVGAGTGTTSIISSNTAGSTDVTLTAGSNITLSEAGNNITIAATTAADGNGIISALPAGDVTIAAAGNGLIVDNMDTLALTATAGMSLKSNDIWLSQSGPTTTNIHTSPFTNFNGTGYVNFNVGYFGVPLEDSVRIVVDGFNDVVLINERLNIDKYAAPKLPHFPSSFSLYTGTPDEGRIVYNSTDDVPMFWDGSAWVNLIDAGSLPAAPTEGYAVVETAATDLQTIANTWEALEAQTSAGLSSGWSFSTSTDLLTYSGSTAKYLVNFSACFRTSAATLYDYTFTVRENGVDGNARAVQRTSGADADPTYCVSGFDVVTANSGDTFGLGFISSSAASSNAYIESSQLVMTKLVGQ